MNDSDPRPMQAPQHPPAHALERPQSPVIQAGVCYGLFAYDIAFSINLEAADRLLTGVKQREIIGRRRRVPPSVQHQPAPLRVTQAIEPIPIAGFSTTVTVDAVIYDFGAISIMYSLPLGGPLSNLLELGEELYDNPALLADSRRRVELVMQAIAPALTKPGLIGEVEDYVLYQVVSFEEPYEISRLLDEHGDVIARVLRAESGPLSRQEVSDALSCRVSYGPNDMAVIDWNASLLLDSEGEDVRATLEFANVELLEMRFLDRRLDKSLNEAYALLGQRGWREWVRGAGHHVRRIAQLQADSAMLFEGVSNSLKLVGDQYLARVYRVASDRLHLPEWDASILRKLQTLESIYSKLSDQQSARRMEVLEWIIIVLIAVSIVLSFWPK